MVNNTNTFPFVWKNKDVIVDFLDRGMESLFDQKTRNIMRTELGLDFGKASFPKVDIIETNTSVVFYVDVTSFRKEDINISYSFEDNLLKISSANQEKKPEYPEMKDKGSTLIRTEIKRSNFKRMFEVSDEIYDCDNIKSSFVDGSLRIEIKKRKEDKKQKEINITID